MLHRWLTARRESCHSDAASLSSVGCCTAERIGSIWALLLSLVCESFEAVVTLCFSCCPCECLLSRMWLTLLEALSAPSRHRRDVLFICAPITMNVTPQVKPLDLSKVLGSFSTNFEQGSLTTPMEVFLTRTSQRPPNSSADAIRPPPPPALTRPVPHNPQHTRMRDSETLPYGLQDPSRRTITNPQIKDSVRFLAYGAETSHTPTSKSTSRSTAPAMSPRRRPPTPKPSTRCPRR